MKRLALFFVVLLLILFSFVAIFGLYEVKFFNTRADVSQSSFSIDNSYIFSTPSQARANGQEKIRLTVFILNNQGLGVLGKKVLIETNSSLTIDTIQGSTDNYGKAYFDISATKPAQYFLEVKIDDKALNQKAQLVFN
ncbi:MAG: hypothetical protein WCT22_00870 [Patescibacteria group bacterium]|jgi:hypothetical protein